MHFFFTQAIRIVSELALCSIPSIWHYCRAYVYSSQKTATGISNKAYNHSNHTFEFRWTRGPHRQACANPMCPRADSFSPVDWSKSALQGCRIQCHFCSKLRVLLHKTIFCNAHCFKAAWKQHRLVHETLLIRQRDGADAAACQKLASSEFLERGQDVPKRRQDVRGERLTPAGGGSVSPTVLPWSVSVPWEEDGGTRSNNLTTKDENKDDLTCQQGNDGTQWNFVQEDSVYTPCKDDVGHCLRLECRAVLPDGSLVCAPKVIVTEPVLCLPPPLPKRGLTTVKSGTAGGGGGGSRFRVVSYNLLAEIYATQQVYPQCDFWALNWKYRRTNLVRELVESQGDILCLQEVQADTFRNFIEPILVENGYKGNYKSKTRESMGMVGKVDGCAIFWRETKFQLLESYAIEFNDCVHRTAENMGLSIAKDQQYLHRLCKDNIAQIAVLEAVKQPHSMAHTCLCVVNTHLYSNPDCPDVKLWQTQALLQEVEHFSALRGLPLVICGDFNSEPTSAVYELLEKSGVNPNHPDLRSDPYSVLPNASELVHGLHLQSAYSYVLGAEPPYTNYTEMFKGTLDYIWCTTPLLRPLAVTNVPTEEEIHRGGKSMPNVQASSDHVLLSVDFIFSDGSGGEMGGGFQGGGRQGNKHY